MTYEDGKQYIGRFEEDRLVDKNNELSEEKVSKLYGEYLAKVRRDKEENSDRDNKSNKYKKYASENISLNKNIMKKASLLNINSIQENLDNKNVQKPNDINVSTNTNEENKKKKESSVNKSKNTSTNTNTNANSKKKLYKFIPIFDLTDLEYNYPEIKDDEEEITKVLLRNLTGINKLYNYMNKISKIEVFNEETGNKKMIIRDDILKRVDTNRKKDSRSTLRSNSNRMATSKKIPKRQGIHFCN